MIAHMGIMENEMFLSSRLFDHAGQSNSQGSGPAGPPSLYKAKDL